MNFSSIITHPEKDIIIEKLVTGTTPKDVNQYLKLKYPKPEQKHLIVSVAILKEFSEKHINMYAQIEKDLKSQSEGKLNVKISDSLLNNKTYQERIAELAGKEVDVVRSLERIVLTLETRLEQIFDKTQQNPEDTKDDFTLIKLHDSLVSVLEKYDKIKNNKPDQIIQHNVTVQMVESHTMIFQEAVREALMQFDADTASRFMDVFIEKLNNKKLPGEEKRVDVNKRLSEVKQLEQIIEANLEED